MEIIPSTPVRPRRTGRLVLGVLAGVLVVLGLLGATPVVRGMERVAMADDAMGSAVPKGSYVLVRQVAGQDLRVGDVVSFGHPTGDGALVRRIREMDGGWIVVSGEADGVEPLTLRAVRVREVVRHVPWVGYPMLVLPAWTPPYLLLGCLGALLLAGMRVSDERARRRPAVLASVVVPRQAPSPARESVPQPPPAPSAVRSAVPPAAPAPAGTS